MDKKITVSQSKSINVQGVIYNMPDAIAERLK